VKTCGVSASLCWQTVKCAPQVKRGVGPGWLARRRRAHTAVADMDVAGVVRSGDRLATSAASLIPASVPRPAAKLAVVGVGGLVALWIFQRVRPPCLARSINSDACTGKAHNQGLLLAAVALIQPLPV